MVDFQTWAQDTLRRELDFYMCRQRQLADALVSVESADAAQRLLAELLALPADAPLNVLRDLLPDNPDLTVWWPKACDGLPVACTENEADMHEQNARAEGIPF